MLLTRIDPYDFKPAWPCRLVNKIWVGKVGRADTSTDPAPLSMIKTVVTLKPKSEWRRSACSSTSMKICRP